MTQFAIRRTFSTSSLSAALLVFLLAVASCSDDATEGSRPGGQTVDQESLCDGSVMFHGARYVPLGGSKPPDYLADADKGEQIGWGHTIPCKDQGTTPDEAARRFAVFRAVHISPKKALFGARRGLMVLMPRG